MPALLHGSYVSLLQGSLLQPGGRDVSFAEPHLLWLLLLAPVAGAAAALLWRRRLEAAAAWAARGLWSRLLRGYRRSRLTASVAFLAVAVLATGLALARPRWGQVEQEVERRGVDLVFVLDSSLSMAALDVPPSRLSAAATVARRLLRAMPENRAGLVQVEGAVEVLSPLTLDAGVLELVLDGVAPGTMERPGTVLGPALEAAAELFLPGAETHRVIVLLSDGEDHGPDLSNVAAALAEAEVQVHTLGVGTPRGAPVPLPGDAGRVKRDQDGEVVISRLEEGRLEDLARATGGIYLRITDPAVDLEPLLERIREAAAGSLGRDLVEIREERFQWPLALAVLALLAHLALAPFRPAPGPRRSPGGDATVPGAGAALLWLLLPALIWTPTAPAGAQPSSPLGDEAAEVGTGEGDRGDAPEWWQRFEHWLHNPRERTGHALEAYRAERPEEAVPYAHQARELAPAEPLTRFNAGTLELAAGLHEQAVASLEEAVRALEAEVEEAEEGPAAASPDVATAAPATPRPAPRRPPESRFRRASLAAQAFYNLGNARHGGGDLQGAVRAYEDALRLAPDHEDAKFNLELTLRELERRRSRQSSPQAPQEGKGDGEGEQPRSPEQQGSRDSPPQQDPEGREEEREQARPEEGEGEPRPAEPELERFEDQPDMSAREAAAILEAVENLERQQRQEEAAARARRRRRGEKDW